MKERSANSVGARLIHDGKLIAVINWTFHVVFDVQDVFVFGRNLNVVNCK